MIKFSAVSKNFDKVQALKNVNLSFEKGNVIALIGPNACGKTTLIKTLLGMVIPSSGEVMFDGQAIQKDWKYRGLIGYMPQIGRYPDNMTVGQVIEMIEDLREDKGQLDKELYESFQLHKILDKKMSTLSGGTRQKVSTYLAFLFSPEVFVLDEPTAALDPVSTITLKEKILKEKAKGKLIIITSHILSELDSIVNHVVYMQEGEVKLNQSLEQLKEDTRKSNLSEAIAHFMSNNSVN